MRVAIIHPWFPQYRMAFFEGLVREASKHDIDVQIFYGDPPPEWEARLDIGTSGQLVRLPTRFYSIGGRTFNRKSLRPVRDQGPFDLFILEQAVRNLETYDLLLQRAPIAFWGHGRTYTKAVGRAQESLKSALLRRGEWFFGYTLGSIESAVAAGFPRDRTTTVQNSIDTSDLQATLASVSEADVKRFAIEHDLRGKTALFVGGLDESKRIGFLLESARLAHSIEPDFRLLVVGAGSNSPLVRDAALGSRYMKHLGPLFGREKALAMRASQLIAMPGRVGLIAVDSFASKLPIVTTDWKWHAPEFEYLVADVNSVVTRDDIAAYSSSLVELLRDEARLARLADRCAELSKHYTVEAMIGNFVSGLKSIRDLRASEFVKANEASGSLGG